MEQLVIVTNKGKSYVTNSANDASGMQLNSWYNVILPDKKQATFNRQDIAQYWLRDQHTGSIIATDSNFNDVCVFHGDDQPSQELYQGLVKFASGEVVPTHTAILDKSKVIRLSNDQGSPDDQETALESEDDGKHIFNNGIDVYIVWTNKAAFKAAIEEYRKKSGHSMPFRYEDMNLDNAVEVNYEDFNLLNKHGLVYAYFEATEMFYLPNEN